MKKLIAMYKNLPPEMRMVLALAGLGAPLSAIYVLKQFFFPDTPIQYLIFGIAILIGVTYLVTWGVSKVFGSGQRKRLKRMESDLAGEGSGGPQSMDVRAAVKANNEKFFGAIKDMRKNLGLSVYELPWYIVIGDSGCGKTKLINEGGLTFSTGKPEGYQLGTLNYNWWFTEDGIFVDMAGRLCNPQDDADHREWQGFLSTVSKGRKGFPINGALVCVSAEHLLADPAEKHERDANTALERLRDLQGKLGITFATYLIITKCDKILGFMQYFDRAERDITIKNQIFGWSRPGAFNEPYDPEQFSGDFDGLYHRMNELRLRRLFDDVDEEELGLAYSFPEEFRQLKDPLLTYVRTLFPLIKNPRAIKNLLFRGAYFTSATQEGSLILRHLKERLGEDAASQFQTLDMYPRKRPHFIKDVLIRKILPEHGLVFRNEGEVVRNRRLGRMLWAGSTVLAVVLFSVMGFSAWRFFSIIGKPRQDAKAAAPDQVVQAASALDFGTRFGGHIETLNNHLLSATLLSVGYGATEPVNLMTELRLRLFEQRLLRRALDDVDAALRSVKPAEAASAEEAAPVAARYMASLTEYVALMGCMNNERPPADFDLDHFKTLCGVIADPGSPVVEKKDAFFAEAEIYFKDLRSGEQKWPNPARLLTRTPFQPVETLRIALTHLHAYLAQFALLSPQNTDGVVAEWMRLRAACDAMESSYASILGSSGSDLGSYEQRTKFRQNFAASYKQFDEAFGVCRWGLPGKPVRIQTLADALANLRKRWTEYGAQLESAYARCESSRDPTVIGMIKALRSGNDQWQLPGLDRELCRQLSELQLIDSKYADDCMDQDIRPNIIDRYPHILALVKAADARSDDVITTTEDAGRVHSILKMMNQRLADTGSMAAGDDIDAWTRSMLAMLNAAAGGEDKPARSLGMEKIGESWRPKELADLYGKYDDLLRRGEASDLMRHIAERMDRAGEWGLAESLNGWKSPVGNRMLRMPLPQVAAAPEPEPEPAPAAAESEPVEVPEEKPKPRKFVLPSERGSQAAEPADSAATEKRPPPKRAQAAAAPKPVDPGNAIPQAATRAFLNRCASKTVDLLAVVDQCREIGMVNESESGGCARAVLTSFGRYTDHYVQSWNDAYAAFKPQRFEQFRDAARDWASLAKLCEPGKDAVGGVAQELSSALSEVLEGVAWARFDPRTEGTWAGAGSGAAGTTWTALDECFKRSMGNWKHGDFVRSVTNANVSTEGRTPPWVTVSDDIRQAWVRMCGPIGQMAELPAEYAPGVGSARKVDWTGLDQLRSQYGLADERISGAAAAFQQRAAAILSAAVSERWVGVQGRWLGGGSSGWPFTGASDTVEFDKFAGFLLEIERAAAYYQPLDSGLPAGDANRARRAEFADAARQWREFLGLNPQGQPSPLRVNVYLFADPKSIATQLPGVGAMAFDDSAQNFYKKVTLDVGLKVLSGGGAAAGSRTLELKTQDRGKQTGFECQWTWTEGALGGQMTFHLSDPVVGQGMSEPYPVLDKKTLGVIRPLSFCAYLNSAKRVGEGNKFASMHWYDLAQEISQRGKNMPLGGIRTVGEVFIFELERKMPPAITPLGQPAMPG